MSLIHRLVTAKTSHGDVIGWISFATLRYIDGLLVSTFRFSNPVSVTRRGTHTGQLHRIDTRHSAWLCHSIPIRLAWFVVCPSNHSVHWSIMKVYVPIFTGQCIQWSYYVRCSQLVFTHWPVVCFDVPRRPAFRAATNIPLILYFYYYKLTNKTTGDYWSNVKQRARKEGELDLWSFITQILPGSFETRPLSEEPGTSGRILRVTIGIAALFFTSYYETKQLQSLVASQIELIPYDVGMHGPLGKLG